MDEVGAKGGRNLYFLINSLNKGGAERQVVTLQKSLGGKIILLENSVQYAEVDLQAVFILNSSSVHSLSGKLVQYFRSLFKLRSIIKGSNTQDKPIIISFLERSNTLNLVSSFFFGQIVILSVRINLDIQYKSAPLFRLFAKCFYRFADAVSTNSEGMRKLLVDQYNIPEKRAVFVPNAYEVTSIQRMSDRPLDYLELENLALKSPFLLSVNRLDEQKLIKAQLILYEELKKIKPKVKLLIVGDGPLRDELVHYGKALDLKIFNEAEKERPVLTDKYDVYFLGLIANPYRLYKLSKCFILTSSYESLPNVVIEALIRNATILAADCRFGPREILTSDINYDINYKHRYGLNNYGVLLPVPSEMTKANPLWSKYLLDIFDEKIDLSFKLNIVNKTEEYSKENVLMKWMTLIKDN
ncbi:MAG: glycosyltransferase [Bacteroidetes bacterium]|nr:glycosyltransferase [Bacteroidota bacterium]